MVSELQGVLMYCSFALKNAQRGYTIITWGIPIPWPERSHQPVQSGEVPFQGTRALLRFPGLRPGLR